MSEFIPHSLAQEDLIFSDANLTIAATGTQWGKSQAGTLWMHRQVCNNKNPKDNFIISAPTYKILQQSIIPYFLFHMGQMGDYNKADGTFRVRGGGMIYFRTETDPDSIVGIPNVKAGWIDEAGKIRLYFWENYQARAAAKGAKTLLTTSPYSLNWLYKDLIKPKLAGKLPEVALFQAASWDNPYHTLSDEGRRDEVRRQMDPRRFNMIFGGEWGQMVGLVYDCFDLDRHIIEPFTLPTGTKYYGGIDFGYTDPFVMVIHALTPDGKRIQVSEFYKSGLTIKDILEVAKQKHKIYGVKTFYADPSQPGYIEEFNRNGLPCLPAQNDIRLGVDILYNEIISDRFYIFERTSPFTLDELSTYHYPEPLELKPDQHSKEQNPVGQDDHALDPCRYVTIMTNNNYTKLTPLTPNEAVDYKKLNHEKRIEHLKRGDKTQKHSEKW